MAKKSFEENMARLEEIVALLEKGDAQLSQSLSLFEEGTKLAADMPADMRAQAVEFADQLGLAFQIRDDMLDVCGDAEEFGKPIGSDKEEGKVTFVDLLGLSGCDRAVRAHTEAAKAAVADFDADGFLAALADSMAERNK